MSWNVASYKASLKKGFLPALARIDPDIFMLQETKINPGQPVPDAFLKHYPYIYSSPSISKKGYSGSLLASKTKPLSVKLGIGNVLYDTEGRIMTAEFDTFYIVCCYIPNAGQKLERLEYKLAFNTSLKSYIQTLQLTKKSVIWAGDLNVAHHDLDIARPHTNQKSAGFTPQERANFTDIMGCLGLVDCWRSLHPDEATYSYFSYRFGCKQKNIGWRIDYFLVDEAFLQARVISSDILVDEYGPSDHVPIVLVIRDQAEIGICDGATVGSEGGGGTTHDLVVGEVVEGTVVVVAVADNEAVKIDEELVGENTKESEL